MEYYTHLTEKDKQVISANGVICNLKFKAKKEGTAKITVTTENGQTSESVVTVKKTNLNLDYRNANNRASAIESLVKRTFNKK